MVIWADQVARYFGSTSARGGLQGGDGGFVETSGLSSFVIAGSVDTSAPMGKAGMWLLDPFSDVNITTGVTTGSIVGGVFTPNQDTAIVNNGTISTALETGNVTITTDNPTGTQVGNITVTDPITRATGGAATTLTLTPSPAGSITVSATGAISGTGGNPLNVNLNAVGGTVSVSAPVTTFGGTFQSSGTTFTNAAGGAITTAGGALTINQTGFVTISDNLSSSGGNISITGVGITFPATIVADSGAGALSVNAGTGLLTTSATSYLLTTGTATLTADTMTLDASGQIGGDGAGSGTAAAAILQPSTAATIGVAGGAGSLNLTVAELDTVRATNVRIGNTAAGAMAVGTWTPAATFAPGVLTLAAGGGITQTGPIDLSTSTSDLLIRGAGDVLLTDATNVFTNVAASKSAGALSITDAVGSTLTVASLTDDLGTANGIATTGVVTLTADSIVANAAVDGGANLISLNATAGSLSGTGAIGGTAGNSVELLATTTITSTTGADSIAAFAAGGVTISNTAPSGTLTVTTVDGTVGIAATGNPVSLTETTGDVTVSEAVNAGASTAAITLNGADKLLTNSSSIVGQGGVTLTADKMALSGGTVNASAGTAILRPNAIAANIDVGSLTDLQATTLELSTAELATVTASTLQVGRTDGTGTLNLTAPIGTADVNAGTLRLVHGNVSSDAATNLGADIGISGTPFVHHLELQANNNVDFKGNNIYLADDKTLTIRADLDNNGLGDVTLLPVAGGAIQVGTTGANAGSMNVTGANINITPTGAGAGAVAVTGTGTQTFTATKGNINITKGAAGSLTVSTAGGTQTFDTVTGALPGTTGHMTVVGTSGSVLVTSNGGTQSVNLTGDLTIGNATAADSSQLGGGSSQTVERNVDSHPRGKHKQFRGDSRRVWYANGHRRRRH